MRNLILVLLLFPLSLSAATFKVTSTNDSGAGSLRQAMLDANAYPCSPVDPCRIEFAISDAPGAGGWYTIAPQSPLPLIERALVTIDGNSQKAFGGDTNPFGPEIEIDGSHAGYRTGIKAFASSQFSVYGLCVNGFEGHGIFVDSSYNPTVAGNYVGVDPTGTVARPNGFDGVAMRNVQAAFVSGNLVSGNRGNGIYVVGANDSSISSNRVGVARDSDTPIPNGANGIDTNGTRVSVGSNVVAFNPFHGIAVAGDVSLFANTIFSNGMLSIAVWPTPQPAIQPTEPPVLSSAVENSRTEGFYTGFPVVTGSVHADPGTEVTVAAYATPYRNATPEARVFIGSAAVKTDANGNAQFTLQRGFATTILDLYGGFVTATAKAEGHSTSAFSEPIPLTITTPTFEVRSTADAGEGTLRVAIEQANAANCGFDAPCRIAFNVPASALTDGAARIVLQQPLPPLRGYVRISGASQTWWQGDTNPDGPEVEIRGGAGLQLGTPFEGVVRAYVDWLVINGSSTDGLTIFASPGEVPPTMQARIIATNVYSGTDVRGKRAVPNAGNGFRLEGGGNSSSIFQTNAMVSGCLFSGNGANGVLLGGEMHTISSSKIGTDASGAGRLPNGGHGVLVIAGTRQQLLSNTIAFNRGDGVATVHGVRMPSVLSSIHDNEGLGIDVNDDGVSPSDGNFEDGSIDPPTIEHVTYDESANVTYIEGTARSDVFPLTPTFGLYGERFGNAFFINDAPDPSGRGEGAAGISWTYPPVKSVEGSNGTFRLTVLGDLRGKWITATTNRFYCYWEAGCQSRESSEFSVAVQAK